MAQTHQAGGCNTLALQASRGGCVGGTHAGQPGVQGVTLYGLPIFSMQYSTTGVPYGTTIVERPAPAAKVTLRLLHHKVVEVLPLRQGVDLET